MDSNLLKVFVSVADTGSLSAASRKLHCVQSNVTARIKQLEEKVGRVLFHRKSRGVVLTQAGETLYGHASAIVRKLEEAEQSMRYLDKAGSLRIGSTESNAAVRLTQILVNLHKTYPDISFTLLTGTSREVTQLLLGYRVDVAFVSHYPDHPDLKILKQYKETMVLIESSLGPVPNVVLGFRQGCAYRELLESYMTRKGASDFRSMEFGSLDTILGCVAAGMGRAIVPLKVVEKLGKKESLNIVRLPKDQQVIPTFMICRKDAVPMILEDLFDVDVTS